MKRVSWGKGEPKIKVRIKNEELRIKNDFKMIFLYRRKSSIQKNALASQNPINPERDLVKRRVV